METTLAPQLEIVKFITAPPLYDLVICSRKIAGEGRILWLKFAGEAQSRPARANVEISDRAIQELLAGYELVKTDKTMTEIVRKYRLVEQGELCSR